MQRVTLGGDIMNDNDNFRHKSTAGGDDNVELEDGEFVVSDD